jgi:molecular chaperone GrpE
MSKEHMIDDNAAADAPDPEAATEDPVIVGLREENAVLKDQAMRYAAEAENIRRRAEREMNDARAFAIQKFARDLLGVADNLARALEHAPKDDADPLARNLTVGLEMTQKELFSAFERNGLKKLDPTPGEKFDPHKHQAVMEQTSDALPPGSVINVLQTGAELYGRIVRPAMVVVAARDSTGAENKDSEAGGDAAVGAAERHTAQAGAAD